MDPGSRLFVSLAEEYRKLGRFKQALSALQKGLLAHPGYIAAQVALGRVYLESGQNTDAIATFTKVLVADPGNLVAAKSLADVYLSRGDSLEALKKYKLYRALAGDRKVDEVIAKLETEVAPRPVTPPRVVAKVELPPPPPRFQETDKGKRRTTLPKPSAPPRIMTDAFEITSVAFDPEDTMKARVEEPFPFLPTRDVSIRSPDVRPPGSASVSPSETAAPQAEAPAANLVQDNAGSRPTGRALADLYYSQGHYAEALQIYDDLVTRLPFDEELMRMRRDAEARLLPAGLGPAAAVPSPAENRRMAQIRALRQWLSLVQAG
jgi:tetratricopeptide (TPR) repeat protein